MPYLSGGRLFHWAALRPRFLSQRGNCNSTSRTTGPFIFTFPYKIPTENNLITESCADAEHPRLCAYCSILIKFTLARGQEGVQSSPFGFPPKPHIHNPKQQPGLERANSGLHFNRGMARSFLLSRIPSSPTLPPKLPSRFWRLSPKSFALTTMFAVSLNSQVGSSRQTRHWQLGLHGSVTWR